MNFYLQLNTKEDILKNVGNQTVDRTPFFFPYYVIQWGPSTVVVFRVNYRCI